MTWETISVALDELTMMLERLRRAGATITNCCPKADRYVLTYCTRPVQ